MLSAFWARRPRPSQQIQLKIRDGAGARDGSLGMSSTPISLVARWVPKPGSVDELRAPLIALAQRVREQEVGTLTYLVHMPVSGDPRLLSRPPVDGPSI